MARSKDNTDEDKAKDRAAVEKVKEVVRRGGGDSSMADKAEEKAGGS